MGTRMVLGHISVPEDLYTPLRMVSRHVWTPVGCPGTYGKQKEQKGAWAHIGTDRVPGVSRNIKAPARCLFTYGNQNGEQEQLGTGRVPGHVWALKACPGTYGHWKGTRAHNYGYHEGARYNMGTGKQYGFIGTARGPGLLWTLRRVQGLRFTLERNQATYGH